MSQQLIDKLEISSKCARYYADIADSYNVYRLAQLSKSRRNLYLLCYINQRYQQMIDNLVTSFIYYNNNFIQEAGGYAHTQFVFHTSHYNHILPQVSTLLRFMGSDGEQIEYTRFWKAVYNILPKNQYLPMADYIAGETFDFEAAKWEFYLHHARRIKGNVRMLFKAIQFYSNKRDGLMEAITFLKDIFNKDSSLTKVAGDKFPDHFIPASIKKYLQMPKEMATPTSIYHPDKYEFYLYQSIVKEIDKGNIFCDESTKYKSLTADLLSDKIWQNKAVI